MDSLKGILTKGKYVATTERKDRVEHMLRINKILGILLMPLLTWALLNLVWPMSGILWWAICGVLSAIGMYYFSLISTIIVVAFIYREYPDKILEELAPLTEDDLAEAEEEDDEDPALKIGETIIVALPEKFLGTYKDFQFYEWLDLQHHDGTIRRVFFEGIADISQPVVMQKDSMLLAPGLLYRYQTAA